MQHALDAGAVAQVLLPTLPQDLQYTWVCCLVSAHDVGKLQVPFQLGCVAWAKAFGGGQTRASYLGHTQGNLEHAALSRVTVAKHWDYSHGVILGAHHSKPSYGPVPQAALGGEEWKQGRQSHLDALVGIWGKPQPIPRHYYNLVAGFVTLCDWIASCADFFPLGSVPQLKTHAGCLAYLKLAISKAQAAVGRLGLLQTRLAAKTFDELFGVCPRPLQTVLGTQLTQPGLYIVEAAMGEGKTEAALWGAQQMLQSGDNRGLYFAAPTQLTSNMLHTRLEDKFGTPHGIPINLLHANSHQQRRDYLERILPKDAGARKWFNRHLQMLSAYGVGTVDQALLGAIITRFWALRIYGLSGKVVILDEIHSYDCYTSTLIRKLIQELISLGCSVILLSATLSTAAREQLLGVSNSPVESQAYPLITRHVQGVTRYVGVPLSEPAAHRYHPVQLRWHSTEDTFKAAILECVRSGQSVICIQNTVARAKRLYRALKKALKNEVPLGLVHSRFTLHDRRRNEAHWVKSLGPNGTRPPCVLVGTQVLEQSLDLDGDVLFTDWAPIDLILQRLGRTWRHDRVDRGVATRVVHILHPAQLSDIRDFKEHGILYEPYILWRSLCELKRHTELRLPGDVRKILDAVYPTSFPPPATAFEAQLYKQFQANVALAERWAQHAAAVWNPSGKHLECHAELAHTRVGREMATLAILPPKCKEALTPDLVLEYTVKIPFKHLKGMVPAEAQAELDYYAQHWVGAHMVFRQTPTGLQTCGGCDLHPSITYSAEVGLDLPEKS